MSTVVTDVRGPAPGFSWRDRATRNFLVSAAILSEMPFLEHLEELRDRLIKCLIGLAVGSLIGFAYTAPIIEYLTRPATRSGVHLVGIEAFEIFSVYFKVALATGICLAAPIILWQIWRFIEPALHKHEKRYAAPFIISTIICFMAGVVFGYGVVAPWLLKLEVAMAMATRIDIVMSSESYIGMLTATMLSMGAIFEMPPIIFILSRIGLVSARFLVRNFKYAILLFSIAAAVLTPSTNFAPMLFFMAVMTGIYAISIFVAMVFGRARKPE